MLDRSGFRLSSFIGSCNLINTWQDAWNTSIHSIVRSGISDCDHGVSTENCFRQDRLEGYPCEALFLQLALCPMDGISKQGAAPLDVAGVLVLSSLMELDAFAV